MPHQLIDFARLLDPVPSGVFFESHWEKRPLHLTRADASYYDEVLTVADLERMISSPEARYPAIQLSRGGAYFPPEAYGEDVRFGPDNFTGVPNVQKIAAEYRAGATIVLPALHRTWTPLNNLCTRIEKDFDHVVHANAYLTPGNTLGFAPHYDTHEVFVLQIAGTKHWCVYEPPIELPHRKQPFSPTGYTLPAQPLLEVDLAPGDLLYLPRGHVHTTTTPGGRCAHVTIGVAVYTWLDLAAELLQSGMQLQHFRRALPPGFASRAGLIPELAAELSVVLDQLRNSADSRRLIDMFLRRVNSSRRPERATFQSNVAVIGVETPLEAPAPDEYRIAQRGDKFSLEFQKCRLLLPRDALPAFESMCRTRTFKVVDLPGPLDIEAKLALARLLNERGFLKLQPA